MPPELTKKRCAFLVDGFNLYHAIDRIPHLHEFKWLDLNKLANAYIKPSQEVVSEIVFFTAIPEWNPKKKERHSDLIDIYKDLGVKVKEGYFQKTTGTCPLCGEYQTHSEKETDVNICLQLIKIGHEASADRVFVITGDNDQVPTIKRFREMYGHSGMEVISVIPPFRKATDLQNAANASRTISELHLRKSVLDDPYVFKDGGRRIAKPGSWISKPKLAEWDAGRARESDMYSGC